MSTRQLSNLPRQLAAHQDYLRHTSESLKHVPEISSLIYKANVLTTLVIESLGKLNNNMSAGIHRHAAQLKDAEASFDQSLEQTQGSFEQIEHLSPENIALALVGLRQAHDFHWRAYEVSIKLHATVSGFLSHYYDYNLNLICRTIAFFSTKRQKKQLEGLIAVMVGLTPVGSVLTVLELLRLLSPKSMIRTNFEGVKDLDEFMCQCILVLLSSEIFSDIANGTTEPFGSGSETAKYLSGYLESVATRVQENLALAMED